MASSTLDHKQPIFSSLGNASGEFDVEKTVEQPLIDGAHHTENYSLLSCILPFLFPALGGLLFGYDIGATSSASISIQSPTLSGTTWYDLSSVEVGLISSGSLYGALIGSVLAFNIADFLGRRKELIAASIFYLVGALITSTGPNFAMMMIGRFIYGIGIGLAMHAAPMYIAETAPSDVRGRLISMKEFFIVIGVVIGYAIGSFLVNVISGWRYMYAMSSPISVIMAIGMWWLPDSPRWLLLCAIQGKGDRQLLRENSISCMCRLRGQQVSDIAAEKVDEIISELSLAGELNDVSTIEMFRGKYLKALFIGCGLVLFQQITGQPSVLYYAASILQSAGFSAASHATRVSILLGLFKLILTGIAVSVVDKLGRRPLLLGGVSGMVISLLFLGAYYTFLGDEPAIAVIGLLLYVGCYQLSFGPIGWLMISEIFPLRMRGRGLSLAVLVNFGANALVTFAFSPIQDLIGAGNVFYIFGGIAVVSLVFIFFIIPETKGLTLEEIEAKLL
ncbi:D-xylose-proton symporter-like 2 [Amaranthus tricolor]|uniref:D-xylose-proton symporter-like 2 n=1 Tax=Amaranthus tricolor TaxID=29722 RepID=UPI00258B53F6|nr:D-xylose-proton symporter-like 2 [Amaranthus tricolor]